MTDLFDKDGKPVEDALTKEELDAMIEKAKEETKKETEEALSGEVEKTIEEYKGTITGLEEELDKNNEELEKLSKLGTKDFNFRRLEESRDKMEEEKKELEDKLKGIEGTIDKKVGEVREEIGQKSIDDAIGKMAGEDKDLAEKIKFHFNSFKPDDEEDPLKRAENFTKRLENAHVLATGLKPQSSLGGNVVSSAGGYAAPAPTKVGGPGKVSEDTKDMGKSMMGLKDEDFKKAEEKGLI